LGWKGLSTRRKIAMDDSPKRLRRVALRWERSRRVRGVVVLKISKSRKVKLRTSATRLQSARVKLRSFIPPQHLPTTSCPNMLLDGMRMRRNIPSNTAFGLGRCRILHVFLNLGFHHESRPPTTSALQKRRDNGNAVRF
jgi:hypothetical protein